MTVRKTFQWLVMIVLFAAVGGGGYLYRLWNQSDEMLRQGILAKCAEIAPEWKFEIGRARFDWNRRVRIYDLRLKSPDEKETLVAVPEIVIHLDREKFTEHQQVVIDKVRLLKAQVKLRRDAAGHWNWRDLPPLVMIAASLPEWEVEEATIRVQFDNRHGPAPTVVLLQHSGLQLIPSGRRQFLVRGVTEIDQGGALHVAGQWDIDSQAWSLDGSMNDIAVGRSLVELALSVSPELHRKMARLVRPTEDFTGGGKEPLAELGIGGIVNLNFRLADPGSQSASDKSDAGGTRKPDVGRTIVSLKPASDKRGQSTFNVLLDIRQGQVTHPALPFGLRDVAGKLYWDNRQFVVRSLTAKNGTTRLALDGAMDQGNAASPGRFEVNLTNLALDERLQRVLPPVWRKYYDSLRPAGAADLRCTLTSDGRGVWRQESLLVTVRDGSFAHEKFPYPVHHVTGTLAQRGEILELQFEGLAGRRPAKLQGSVKNPGPNAEMLFDIRVDRLPLDDTFAAACPEATQKALAVLKLEGLADVHYRLYRPPPQAAGTVRVPSVTQCEECAGRGRHTECACYQTQLAARVTNGAIESPHFPWRLSNLSGDVTYSSETGVWTFGDLKAVHGTAQVSGSGSFLRRAGFQPADHRAGSFQSAQRDPQAHPQHSGRLEAHPTEAGRLELDLQVTGARFDKSLQLALPVNLQQVWDDLSPSGVVDAHVKIDWVPGQPVVVALPHVQVFDGSVVLKSFPFPLEHIQAICSYADGVVNVTSLSAKHDDTAVRAKGFVQTFPAGDWRVRIVEFQAGDLVPDRLFRRALPPDLRSVFEQLNPRGPVSLTGMLEFRGTGRPQDPVTAAWGLEAVFTDAAVTAGIDLEHIHGRVQARGTWDGRHVAMLGDIDLDSVVILDHQFTQFRGPFQLDDQQLVVGSPEIMGITDTRRAGFQPAREDLGPLPDPRRRVTARAIGGVFTLDAAVTLTDEPDYRVKMTLAEGQLEQYARRYLPGPANLRGVMNGWTDLRGRGSSPLTVVGRGQLRISPAALYELPIIVQMFKVLTFVPPDRTAFTYALADFNIDRGQFRFNTIDLVGDAISLRGRGTAGFDGKLDLDFYSMLSRNQLSIPLFSFVLGEATKGWVGVQIRGKTTAPVATIKPVPTLDNALRDLLGTFDPRPPGTVPRLRVPTLSSPLRPPNP